MKLIRNFGFIIAGLALITSCSGGDMEEQSQNPFGQSDAAYFTLNISPSPTTRTASPTDGVETGQEKENSIHKALLIFANNEDKFIALSELTSISSTPYNNTYTEVFTLSDENFTNLQTSGAAGMHLFVVTNYPSELPSKFTTSGTSPVQQIIDTYASASDAQGLLFSNASWTTNGIMMSGYNAVTTLDISGIKSGKYSTPNNPCPLGEINVYRALSRFDICKTQPTQKTLPSGIDIEFDGVALVNVSKKFNLLKEVGTTGAWKYFDKENGSNFVNDPYDSQKQNLDGTTSTGYSEYFLVPAVTTPAKSLTYTPFTSITNNDNSTITWPNSGSDANGGYQIWTYCTPNSVTNAKKQINGNSTGVVFRAEIKAASGGSLPVTATGNDLYALNGVIYGDLDKLASYSPEATDLAGQQMKNKYTAAVNGKTLDSEKKEALKAAGFTVYEYDSSASKYYCYYYYWNKHNENTDPNEMGNMEFASVRNNVYKLAVTKVSALGHPGDYTPVASTPNESPEPEDAYFEVSVKVLDWEVRVNNIEF